MLFQKRVVHINFNIYVYISQTNNDLIRHQATLVYNIHACGDNFENSTGAMT